MLGGKSSGDALSGVSTHPLAAQAEIKHRAEGVPAEETTVRGADAEGLREAHLVHVADANTVGIAVAATCEDVYEAVAVIVDAVAAFAVRTKGVAVRVSAVRAPVAVVVATVATHVGADLVEAHHHASGITCAA